MTLHKTAEGAQNSVYIGTGVSLLSFSGMMLVPQRFFIGTFTLGLAFVTHGLIEYWTLTK